MPSGASPRRPDAPARERFALAGRSVPLDPRTHAVRPDLADVRLARQVFAPHYAAAVRRVTRTATTLRAGRPQAAEVLATLDAGAPFELLDLIGGDAWGIAPDAGLVGYLDADSLRDPDA